MKRIFVVALALVLSLAGCDRRDEFAAPDSSSAPHPPAVTQGSAYLSVSELSPARGATIVVIGTVKISDTLSLGSFRVRLGFDSTKLQFIEEIPDADMMRVVNPKADEVIVVGASSQPSSAGRLFAFRMRVDDPAGINSLMLFVDELNDAAFRDQRLSVRRAALLVHDRSLARLVRPR
jgi:hypothetical protein